MLFQGHPKVFRYTVVPPVCPGSAPGLLSSWAFLKHLHGEASRRHPNQIPEPPQLAPLNSKEQQLYSKLDDQISHFILKG